MQFLPLHPVAMEGKWHRREEQGTQCSWKNPSQSFKLKMFTFFDVIFLTILCEPEVQWAQFQDRDSTQLLSLMFRPARGGNATLVSSRLLLVADECKVERWEPIPNFWIVVWQASPQRSWPPPRVCNSYNLEIDWRSLILIEELH